MRTGIRCTSCGDEFVADQNVVIVSCGHVATVVGKYIARVSDGPHIRVLCKKCGDELLAEEEVPCKWCGTPTPMTGTEECDPCYELRWRIDPARAKAMLAAREEP